MMHRDISVYCDQGPDYLPASESGVLSGLSFVFKDLFDVEGFTTGAGNPAWLKSHTPAKDTASLIKRTLANGAQCKGRVQTDELAYSLNGMNIHYGTPVNPAAPQCLPGGSSSGSAVAVAKGDVDFSFGTDTGGSIRVPASYCGLFGLRPSIGKLPLDNSFTLARSFDTAGLLTRDLDTLNRVFLSLVASEKSASCAPTSCLDKALMPLMGSERLELLTQWASAANIALERVDVLAEHALSLPSLSELFRQIQGFEIIAEHGSWLDKWQHTLDRPILERIQWARTLTQRDYQQAKIQQAEIKACMQAQLGQQARLWILPTTPGAPPKLTMPEAELAQYRSDLLGLTSLAGLSGFPQLHIPMHNLTDGPCGISLMGTCHSEACLIATAQALLAGVAK